MKTDLNTVRVQRIHRKKENNNSPVQLAKMSGEKEAAERSSGFPR